MSKVRRGSKNTPMRLTELSVSAFSSREWDEYW